MKVTKTMTTSTAHRLMNYDGPCQYVHGHTYRWELTIEGGALNGQGMLFDFGEMKELLKMFVHNVYDHAAVFHQDDPIGLYLLNAYDIHGLNNQRIVQVPWNPTAENLALDTRNRIQEWLDLSPDGDYISTLRVWETDTCYAEVNHV